MKKNLLRIGKCLLSLALIVSAVSCDELASQLDDNKHNSNDEAAGITISNVTPSFNSVTFDIDADDALAIAYIALPNELEEENAAEYIFENGTARGESSGTFTLSDLKSETAYTLYVASKSQSGNKGPISESFTTLENVGEPATSKSAGVRIESLTSGSMVFELINGKDIDFSLVMVRPTIIMENYAFEASKEGIKKEDYIKDFMLAQENGNLSKQTKGAGTAAKYNYDEICSIATPLYPAANYTIYALGCTGDFDDVASIEAGDLTILDFTTEAIERTGDPQLEIKCLDASYDFIRHEIIPNDDCTYWGTFFTDTKELNEFKAHYDELEGEGAGRKRLHEYLMHADPYVTDIELNENRILTKPLGTEYVGMDFSRLALAFDKNRVAAADYEEDIRQLKPIDTTIAPAEYEISINEVGAGNLYLNTTLQGNCATVFWRVLTEDEFAEFDTYLATEAGRKSLGRLLFDEGWAEFREPNTNANHDEVIEIEHLVYGLPVGAKLRLIATAVNYDAGIADPKIIGDFTTLGYTKGDYEPAVKIDAEVGKTNAILTYTVNADAREKDDRMLYQRIYTADSEEVTTYPTLDEMYGHLTKDFCFEFNEWTLISNDTADKDPYKYSFPWGDMTPNTKYICYYMTLNGQGVFSKLSTFEFTTTGNDGGAKPYLTITVDPESIKPNESFPNMFGAVGKITPNDDVVGYKYAFIDEKAVESFGADADVAEDLQYQLYAQLTAQGISAVAEAYNEAYTFSKRGRVWLMAQGQGANGTESPLSYVEINADGTIKEQVDVDVKQFQAPAEICNTHRNFNQAPQFDRSALLQKSATDKQINGEELRAAGIPYYSMHEITLRAMRLQRAN